MSGDQYLEFFKKTCKENTLIVTDEFRGFNILNRQNEINFNHKTVNHLLRQYKNEEGYHTNGIESHWSRLKRAHYGTYHHMNEKYLQKYIDECDFRQNNRKNKSIFYTLLKQSFFVKYNDMKCVNYSVFNFSSVDTYCDYSNMLIDYTEDSRVIKSIKRDIINRKETFIIERLNKNNEYQLWEFENDFNYENAVQFLQNVDNGKIAA